ncbi:hypothetical protein L208DRAFT_1339738, partial [Tricholoma matsutake]
KVHRSKRHAGMVQCFLQGNTQHTPAMIIDAWFWNPDGCISAGSAEDSLMYSTDTPYLEIQSIRAALTSFAVQIVEKMVVKEAQLAVHPRIVDTASMVGPIRKVAVVAISGTQRLLPTIGSHARKFPI